MHALTPREHEVLKTIMEDYIATAQPVGSRAVSKRSGLALSPASMRNVMADLTDKGFLEQPHTSAGRVPTAQAFRFYLDTGLPPRPIDEDARTQIQTAILSSGLDLHRMLTQASRLMAGLTHQVSMVISPGLQDARWKEIDFVRIKAGLVLAVLVLEGGEVCNKILPVEDDVCADELRRFANFLNDSYRGKTLREARGLIRKELADARKQLSRLCHSALLLARETCDRPPGRDIIVDGAANIPRHVEFTDIERLRDLLSLLEERSRLLDILDKILAADQDSPGLRVTLGQEDQYLGEGLKSLSVISTGYGDSATPRGTLAIIGPMRMDYASIVPMVDTIAQTLTSMLKARF
ncbi:heat-inducible transcriptional repressor HrcA [Megalodesulfovibrio paquesii]